MTDKLSLENQSLGMVLGDGHQKQDIKPLNTQGWMFI